MKTFLSSLLSRKFLLTVAALLTAVANGDVMAAVTVVLAYLGVQGATDYKAK